MHGATIKKMFPISSPTKNAKVWGGASSHITCTYSKFVICITANKILSKILLSRLIPYAEQVIGDHQCGFQRNGSTTIIYSALIRQKW